MNRVEARSVGDENLFLEITGILDADKCAGLTLFIPFIRLKRKECYDEKCIGHM